MSQSKFVGQVEVTLKRGVLDPQGKAVAHGLHSLGFDAVKDVRIGKWIEVTLEAPSAEKARELLQEMAEKLLANPVIETFKIKVS